ncbi:CDP-glycerol glycerophosphotransferase family protein [Candidatus Methylopumilus turicensis]|uniref:CDP-glycerol:poly(Glycerophosphate) glycerophosphotransferase n=1 Tax=Candidatus Methylopumilus turicensis TaxID=1581680 RepID=A0A0B7IV98_9PROT|nr:CDP-glycerol glycerophosphotransferase family protein [Candidatus Methylopumilus turicensis]CEN56211.1 protein of unknown function [Candidatus Methylopumilus turicensis]
MDKSIFIKKIKTSDPFISEVLCRKYLSEVGDDIEIWKILFDALIFTKNNFEVKLLVENILKRDFFSVSYLLLSIRYLLLSNNFPMARQLFLKIDFQENTKDNYLKNDFYHLALIEKIRNNISLLPLSYVVMPTTAHEFNLKASNLFKTEPIDVVCFIAKDFHYSIQHRIAEELLNQNVKVIFSNSIWFIKTIKPKLILISEALYGNLSEIRTYCPNALIVNTRHGLGDKNHAAIGASHCDKICVSSESIRELMVDEMLVPNSKIWVTGYPQLDDFFYSSPTNPSSDEKSHTKSILFAPTFNQGLSAAFFLQTDLVKKLRGADSSIKLIVKPHPHLLGIPNLIKSWLDESKSNNNTLIDTNPNSNITKYFHECDLMVSDVSSAALAWLLVDKPLICLIDRKLAEASGHYSPDAIEWKMHSAASVVTNPLELYLEVKNQLKNPNIKSKQRDVFSNFLFGNLKDGKSSLRVAKNIIKYLRENVND